MYLDNYQPKILTNGIQKKHICRTIIRSLDNKKFFKKTKGTENFVLTTSEVGPCMSTLDREPCEASLWFVSAALLFSFA